MKYFVNALNKYSDFNGNEARKDYWMFILIYLVLNITFAVIDLAIGHRIISFIYSIVLLIPLISITARRLHDTGRSGWWQLISFIPLGAIVLIVLLAQATRIEDTSIQAEKHKPKKSLAFILSIIAAIIGCLCLFLYMYVMGLARGFSAS